MRTGRVVIAALMPHAPVLVPQVAGGRGARVQATVAAMREAARRIVQRRPGSLVLISPHSPRRRGAIGIWSGSQLRGDLGAFGWSEAQVSLPGDELLAHHLSEAGKSRGLSTWPIPAESGLDHGASVPLWFLVEAGWRGPTLVASLDEAHTQRHADVGGALAAAIEQSGRPTAVVASGDMSHRLIPGAPAGYRPGAAAFDHETLARLRAGDFAGLSRLDAARRESAAEDAIDSTLIAAAAVRNDSSGHDLLHYEGPFGVGYGVAVLFDDAAHGDVPSAEAPAMSGGSALPGLARDAVRTWLEHDPRVPPAAWSDYVGAARGVFVTVRNGDGSLRGCIGTVRPQSYNLVHETWRNARSAAFRDPRFSPVNAADLPHVHFEVSVLHPPEPIGSPADLDPGRFGVLVTTPDGRRGVLLPGVDGIDSAEMQIAVARRKASIAPTEPATVERFAIDRFDEPIVIAP